jgi:hypothetical protein
VSKTTRKPTKSEQTKHLWWKTARWKADWMCAGSYPGQHQAMNSSGCLAMPAEHNSPSQPFLRATRKAPVRQKNLVISWVSHTEYNGWLFLSTQAFTECCYMIWKFQLWAKIRNPCLIILMVKGDDLNLTK